MRCRVFDCLVHNGMALAVQPTPDVAEGHAMGRSAAAGNHKPLRLHCVGHGFRRQFPAATGTANNAKVCTQLATLPDPGEKVTSHHRILGECEGPPTRNAVESLDSTAFALANVPPHTGRPIRSHTFNSDRFQILPVQVTAVA